MMLAQAMPCEIAQHAQPNAAQAFLGLGRQSWRQLGARLHRPRDRHGDLRIDTGHRIGDDGEEAAVILLLDGALRGVPEEQRIALPPGVEDNPAAHYEPDPAETVRCAVALASDEAPVNRTLTICFMPLSIGTERPRDWTIR